MDKKNIVQKVVVAGVVKSNKGVLILQRHKNESTFPGLWELPSGKKEPLETVESALAREIKEETGITGEPLLPVSVFNYVVEKAAELRDSTQINYLFKPTTHNVALSGEHQAFAWVNSENIAGYEMSSETRNAIERALTM